MVIYNEDFEVRRQVEEALVGKWSAALEAENISDEHMARTTAILLENYLGHLDENKQLIAEDQIQTSAFTGVNLALLGLIARVIPQLIGLELCGVQAMPTPSSPIFTLQWYKNNQKGQTNAGEEMWVSPIPPVDANVGLDPFYTSSQIRGEGAAITGSGAAVLSGTTYNLAWGSAKNPAGNMVLLFASSMYVTFKDAAGVVLTVLGFGGDYNSTSFSIVGTPVGTYPNFDVIAGTIPTITFLYVSSPAIARQLLCSAASFTACKVGGTAVADVSIDYDYKPENESMIPEMTFQITSQTILLQRRQLRGNYTLDSAFDLKKLHGVDLESAIMDMMKQELMAEINRELVTTLRMMAAVIKTVDFAVFPANEPGQSNAHQVSINANYDDAHKLMLDAIEKVCAEIWTVGRRGYGNWVVGNPATLSFLDRVPGFVGSGVTYNGRDLAFAGTLGGKIKFYHDPLYPRNELLMGYKGQSPIDNGFFYCPYLPITATPTLMDPYTGNPRKLYYTRYGKTFSDHGNAGMPQNFILMGEYQYARLILKNFPALFSGNYNTSV